MPNFPNIYIGSYLELFKIDNIIENLYLNKLFILAITR